MNVLTSIYVKVKKNVRVSQAVKINLNVKAKKNAQVNQRVTIV